MKLNRRTLIATSSAAGAAALGGGVWWFTRDEGDPRGASDRIDLLAGAYTDLPHTSDPVSFCMLSLTGGMPGRSSMELRFFDPEATPITDPGDISATLRNLVTGEEATDIQIMAEEDYWTVQQSTLQSDGWWQLRIQAGESTAMFTILMPDPNLTGMDTPPNIKADPNATAMLAAALDTLSNRTSLRWWEWLSGGNGSIILASFAVTTPESNGLPEAFENDSVLAGRIPLDGSEASFREENTRRISTEGVGSVSINGGTPEAGNAITFLPISEYHTTYSAHEAEHFGIVEMVEGRECQLLAFHLPGAIPAWFAFWIEIETLLVRELFMLSVNHYMHWVYTDFDEPFELTFDP